MKINIQVDLDDLYPEGDDASFSEEVECVIKYEVRKAIGKAVSNDVERIASSAYEEFGQQKIKSIVDSAFEEFIDKGEVRKYSCSDELITVKEKMRMIFDGQKNWSAPHEKMKKMGEQFASECRKRYDLSFASNIVTGLERQGLLKPGAFEAITSDKNS